MGNDTQIIAASISVDTGNSSKEVNQLNKDVKGLNTSLTQTGATVKDTGEQVKGGTQHFGKLKDTMGALPGPLGQATSGVNTLSSGFKALLANPVGIVLAAIVATLLLLYKAFQNSFAGAQKLEQVFAGLKATAQSLLDNLDKIGSALLKAFTFDFSGAVDDIKAVGTAAVDAFNSMSKLTQQAQALKREQLQNDLEGAERAKKLAILREQANDDSIPAGKRKAALKALQADAEQNAKDDIDLARRTAENKIAMLTLEKDGAKKNAEEITKIKIEQINGESENANELRRINKQVTAVEKQEQAERTAANKEALEKKKADQQAYAEAVLKLNKLQQENTLLGIKDGYEKENQALEFKIAEDKRINDQAFKDKKITKEVYLQLELAQEVQANLQRQALSEKHNLELAKKEEDFQKELSAIAKRTRIAGITDAREAEKVQLQIGYEEKLQDAIIRYKDDAVKLQQYKNSIDAELKANQDKLDAKNKAEDAAKKFADGVKKLGGLIDDPAKSLKDKKALLDQEVADNEEAFKKKEITEAQYLDKKKQITDAYVLLEELQAQATKNKLDKIAEGLGIASDLAGKQTAAGKALAIAQTAINTYQAGFAAFKGMVSVIPGPVGIAAGVIAAAGAVAAGIASVKKIVAVQIPGQGGGGGSVPTAGSLPAAPVAPTAQSTLIAGGAAQDISTIAKTAGRSYIVEADVQNSSDRSARLERASRIGG